MFDFDRVVSFRLQFHNLSYQTDTKNFFPDARLYQNLQGSL